MKRVPYSSEEFQMIIELYEEEMAPKDIVKLINDIYHNEKPVRNKRTIRYILSKLEKREEKNEDVWSSI